MEFPKEESLLNLFQNIQHWIFIYKNQIFNAIVWDYRL